MTLSPEMLDALEAEGNRLEAEARRWDQAAAAVREVVALYRADSVRTSQNCSQMREQDREQRTKSTANLSPAIGAEEIRTRSDAKRAATQEREKAIAAACKNTAMTTVAESFGISVGTVRRCRNIWPELSADDPEEEETANEGAQEPEAPTRADIRAAKEAEAAELYESGKSVEEIAAAVGVCKATVFNWKRAGNWDRGKGHADRQIDRWEQRRAVVADPDKVQNPPENRSKSQTALPLPDVAKSPICQYEHNGKFTPSDDDESQESPGRIFLESNPPPPYATPGSEPGWVKLPAQMPEPKPPPASDAPPSETLQRRCQDCANLTTFDPCHICHQPWRNTPIAAMSA